MAPCVLAVACVLALAMSTNRIFLINQKPCTRFPQPHNGLARERARAERKERIINDSHELRWRRNENNINECDSFSSFENSNWSVARSPNYYRVRTTTHTPLVSTAVVSWFFFLFVFCLQFQSAWQWRATSIPWSVGCGKCKLVHSLGINKIFDVFPSLLFKLDLVVCNSTRARLDSNDDNSHWIRKTTSIYVKCECVFVSHGRARDTPNQTNAFSSSRRLTAGAAAHKMKKAKKKKKKILN